MGLFSAMTIIPKIKAPEASDLLEAMWKIFLFFLWIISYSKTISLLIYYAM